MTNETTASQPKSIGDDAQGEVRKVHHLKTDPEVFDAVARGVKTHEIRLNDRDFQVGDRLVLAETESTGSAMRSAPKLYPLEYTGRTESRIVSHIQTGYGLADGWCILSFRAPAAQASATIQAAPDESNRAGWFVYEGNCWVATSSDDPRATKLYRAATIQEPVMVAEAKRLGCKIPADMAEQLAAPMVADPAGAAEGWQLVPKIPTPEMIYNTAAFDLEGEDDQNNACDIIYRAMLAAAPEPDAATVKAVPKIRITLRQARRLVEFFGGHDADMTVTERPADWGQVEEGLYAFCTEYPEDGAQFLGATETDDELMRLDSVKAVPSDLTSIRCPVCCGSGSVDEPGDEAGSCESYGCEECHGQGKIIVDAEDVKAVPIEVQYQIYSAARSCWNEASKEQYDRCNPNFRRINFDAPLADKTGGGE